MNDDAKRQPPEDQAIIDQLRAEIDRAEPSRKARILEKFFLAALSVIPWVGGVLSAAEAFRTEEGSVPTEQIANSMA